MFTVSESRWLSTDLASMSWWVGSRQDGQMLASPCALVSNLLRTVPSSHDSSSKSFARRNACAICLWHLKAPFTNLARFLATAELHFKVALVGIQPGSSPLGSIIIPEAESQ